MSIQTPVQTPVAKKRSLLRNAVIFSAIQQFTVFKFAALMSIFGGGLFFICTAIAIGLSLALTMLIGLSRKGMPTKRDAIIISWSFLPILLLTYGTGIFYTGYSG